MSTTAKSGSPQKKRRKWTRISEDGYRIIAQFVVENPNMVVKQVAALYSVSPAVVYKAIADHTTVTRTLRTLSTQAPTEPVQPSES